MRIFRVGGVGVHASRTARRVLWRCRGRRCFPGVRQSGSAVVCQRDGAACRREQRRDGLQRHEQHRPNRGTSPRRPAHRYRRLRMVFHGRRHLLCDGTDHTCDDALCRAAAGAGDAWWVRTGTGRTEVHRQRARPLDHLRHAPARRDHQLQLSPLSFPSSWRKDCTVAMAPTPLSTRLSALAAWSGRFSLPGVPV